MPRLCLFGDAPAVEGGSRCLKHGGNATTRQGPSPYDHTYRKQRERMLKQATTCHICGLPPTPDDPLEADHVLPLSMGGPRRGELKPAHRSCNIRKGGANRA